MHHLINLWPQKGDKGRVGMKFRWKHRLHFLKKELGFLIGLISTMTFLLVPMDKAVPSVINIPKPLPDIVKSYKSVTINAQDVGMLITGVQVQNGDTVTILAKGTINVWPSWTPGAKTSDGRTPTTDTGNFLMGPKRISGISIK